MFIYLLGNGTPGKSQEQQALVSAGMGAEAIPKAANFMTINIIF
jgi:hypothetical protein